MGNCVKPSQANADQRQGGRNRLRLPRPWRMEGRGVSWGELQNMRATYWSNAPRAYGGRAVIWEGLHEAAECEDLIIAQRILDQNSIRYPNGDMTLCIDDQDHRYELPPYVISEPTNLNYPPTFMERIFRRRQ